MRDLGSFRFDPLAYPELPGIYRMRGLEGQVLYIGKALNLRKRLGQYFQKKPHDNRFQLDLLIPQIESVEVVATSCEKDALILENQLIKSEKPKYNIRLRDDKTYPFIRLSKDEFPRIELSRKPGDGVYDNFGPYTEVATANGLIELIVTHFGLRRCPQIPMKKLERPCLYAQIGQCSAPCTGAISALAYGERATQVRQILLGNTRFLKDHAQMEMQACSSRLDYERAAFWRDLLRSLDGYEKRSIGRGKSSQCLDAFSCVESRGWQIIHCLRVIGGQLSDRETIAQRAILNWEDLMPSFLLEFYSYKDIPPLILTDREGENMSEVAEILSERSDRKVKVHKPIRGILHNWSLMSLQNARAELSCREATGGLGSDEEYLLRVWRELDLPRIPFVAVALDLSNLGGEEPCGAVVCFRDGKPDKRSYRHYRIRGEAAGDAAGIREVLLRHLKKLAPEDLPDAILVDGGLQQLSAAAEALQEAGYPADRGLLALSKGAARIRGEEILHFHGDATTRRLAELPASMRLWTHLRDEAHRFSRRLMHKRTSSKRLRSPLLDIPGIGPAAERALRKACGPLSSLRKLPPEKLEEIKGLSRTQKDSLRLWLHGRD
ncbi:MAG: excinuclease ABC subunit UvrC [Planctomycetes bacterium]|nr:excinuclease ABC subunit UvrC [Planctomycetota bacterium]